LIQHAILVVVAYDQTKNTSLLDLPNTNFDGLDEDFLKLTIQSAKLSSAIMRPNGTIEYPEAAVFLDEPDEAWLVKIENICFVAFRGTLESSPEDISQNTDLAIADDVCYNGECCSARQGYRDAVLRPLYREDLDASVRACVNSCSSGEAEEDCGLILTGFSQGGSAAMIAAVTMRDMDRHHARHGSYDDYLWSTHHHGYSLCSPGHLQVLSLHQHHCQQRCSASEVRCRAFCRENNASPAHWAGSCFGRQRRGCGRLPRSGRPRYWIP